jgi:hypothetical protein
VKRDGYAPHWLRWMLQNVVASTHTINSESSFFKSANDPAGFDGW